MTTQLIHGQTISVVTIRGIEYVSNALTMGTTPFKSVTTGLHLLVQRFDIYEAIERTELITEDYPSILDGDGNAYYKLSKKLDNTTILL
jgi:hypothetical protein